MDRTIVKLEHDISTFINKDNGATVHFEYEYGWIESKSETHIEAHTANVYTHNIKTGETFLLKSSYSITKEKALEQILEYVKTMHGLSSFTVKWKKAGDNDVYTSYFYCHDVTDVVKKFFTGKDVIDYIIYEIKLNPLS